MAGGESTREQIVAAADRLFYRQGFETTSFADIAAAVKISRGNFYYHFRSKDEILDAVVARRLDDTHAILQAWAAQDADPAARIRSFIGILLRNRESIMAFGCPVGTLATELAKLRHPAQGEAVALFDLFRTWLRRQFELAGRTADADVLAMHLLARSQGVATLANAYRDEAFVAREVAAMCDWLETQIAAA
ncbi:TetR/AcrR family transcriptional regulator [Marinibaculum pumilum]|uniref:TetR/AcrR family transcriptional regulator n=1 Tax=Marinibaculum pumilum TaxID=1766165 RepID=A0ABV7L287_9PROT